MRRAANPIRFAGYAALFDIPDGARDVIRPGAFARTLAEDRERLWTQVSGADFLDADEKRSLLGLPPRDRETQS